MDVNLHKIYTIRKTLRDLYSTMSLILFVILFGTLVGIDASDRKCTFIPTDGKRLLAYACVQADLNDLQELPSEAEWIEFSVSRFPRIPADAFSRFSRLRRLAFYNCDIRDIDPAGFQGLNDLEWLILYKSKIGVVRASWFRHLPNLRRLVLDGNEIVYVEPEAFSGLTRLTSLSLRDNDLNCLPIDFLSNLPRLKTVEIDRNPWLCNCQKDLNLFFEKKAIDTGSDGRSFYNRRNECMTDVKLPRNQTTSQTESIIASSGDVVTDFSSLSRLEDATQWIRIKNVSINQIPSYAFFRFGNSLRSLEFLNCNITEIEDDAFAGLAKLERLVLIGNYLNVIRASWFRELVNLQILILDANQIERIEYGAFSSLSKLRHLSLQGNALQCLSISELRKLVQLEKINLRVNPWNCSCQAVLKNYLAENRIGYDINDFRCELQPLQPHEFEKSGKIVEWFDTHQTHQTHQTHETHQTHQSHQTHETDQTHQTHKEALENTNSILTLEPVTETMTGGQTIQVTPPLNSYDEGQLGKGFCISRQKAEDLPGSRFPYTCHQATLAHTNVIPSTVDALIFSSSYIPTVTRSSFARFGENLKILKLLNCRTNNIEPDAFVDLIGLQTLIINDNDLETVRESWFQGLNNLRHLSLTGNKINRIENGVFTRLPNLVTLHIDNNRMNCIGLSFLEKLHYLRSIRITENPWTCLCRLRLIQFLEERGISYERHVFQNEIYANESECFGNWTSHWLTTTRPSATGVPITIDMPTAAPSSLIRPTDPIVPNHYATVSTKEGQCIYEKGTEPGRILNYKCTDGDLSVLLKIPSNAESIELHDVFIPYLPAGVFSRFQNLTKLVIHKCKLREVDPRAFENLFRLQELTIHDNHVTTIDSSWFRDTNQLRNLSVTKNSLTEIPPNAFKNLAGSLERLSLQENDLTCIYTSILADLRQLKSMEFGQNKLKWRCWEEVSQYLESRHVNYTKMPNPCNSRKLVWDLFGQKSEKLVASSADVSSIFKFLTIGLMFLIRCF